MKFPIYVIHTLDLTTVDKKNLLGSGETRIEGVIFVSDFGVALDMPQQQVVLTALPSASITFEKALEQTRNNLCLFAQYQAELFWFFGIKQKHITKDKNGYSKIALPMKQCVVGRF